MLGNLELLNITWNNQFFPTTKFNERKTWRESFAQEKRSSFICRTEILKSFQFFATLFSFLFHEVGSGLKVGSQHFHCLVKFLFLRKGNEQEALSGPNGMQHIYECIPRLKLLEKCCKTGFLQVNSIRNEQQNLRNFVGEFSNWTQCCWPSNNQWSENVDFVIFCDSLLTNLTW